MISTIGNDRIRVAVQSMGAELASLQTPDGHEYLWQGDPDSWAGRSPVLFPIIGGLPNDTYTVDGREYRLGSHGFARRTEFSLREESPTALLYATESTDETLAVYPYRFELQLGYVVEDSRVTISYSVVNTDNTPMLFSIGGHPGFRCPLESTLSFQDYRLRFDRHETVGRHIKAGGLLSGETEPLLEQQDTLPLTHELFDRGALILRDLASTRVSLESDAGSRRVTVDFAEFPDLGIWSHASRAPFVCIEPWFGVDSSRGDSPELKTKAGLVELSPAETFTAAFDIAVE